MAVVPPRVPEHPASVLLDHNALALALDLWRPKLDWTDPQGTVKQNFNVLLAMLAGVVSLGGAALAAYMAAPFGHAVGLAPVFEYLLLLAAGSTALVLGAAGRVYRLISAPSS